MKMAQYLVVPVIVALFAGAVYFLFLGQPVVCDHCGRPLHQESLYRIHLRNGEVKQSCCPRCGLYFQQGRDDVVLVEVADFRTSKLMDATQAIYVEDSSVNMCYLDSPVHRHIEGIESTLAWDRCMPGLLAFESREAAEDFRSEKGGLIKTYNQLLKELL
jgi:hypothetical protein